MTADYIQSVGFERDETELDGSLGEPRYVEFKYVVNGTTATMEVPFLVMVPIPYLEIEYVTIDFNAEITSTVQTASESTAGLDVDVEVGRKGFFSPSVSFKAGFSWQKEDSSSTAQTRRFSLNIKVRASQAPLPEGTSRILTLLERLISEQGEE